ncbi:MAG: hypothetical protein ACRDQZ_15715, partial [Mycobacteriales bacterium]
MGNPSRGAALWQQADRRAVDRAAWVPLVNSLGIDVLGRGFENSQRNPSGRCSSTSSGRAETPAAYSASAAGRRARSSLEVGFRYHEVCRV